MYLFIFLCYAYACEKLQLDMSIVYLLDENNEKYPQLNKTLQKKPHNFRTPNVDSYYWLPQNDTYKN